MADPRKTMREIHHELHYMYHSVINAQHHQDKLLRNLKHFKNEKGVKEIIKKIEKAGKRIDDAYGILRRILKLH